MKIIPLVIGIVLLLLGICLMIVAFVAKNKSTGGPIKGKTYYIVGGTMCMVIGIILGLVGAFGKPTVMAQTNVYATSPRVRK